MSTSLTQPILYLGDGITISSYNNNTQVMQVSSTCKLTLDATPTNTTDGVNKGYVDAQVSFLTGMDASMISSISILISSGQAQDSLSLIALSGSISTLSTSTSTSLTSLTSSVTTLSTSATSGINSLSTSTANSLTSLTSSVTGLSTSTSTRFSITDVSLNSLTSINDLQTSQINSLSITDVSLNTSIISLSTSTSSGISSVLSTTLSEIDTRSSQVVSLFSGIQSLSTSTTTSLSSLSTRVSIADVSLNLSITSLSTSASTSLSSLTSSVSNLSTSTASHITSLSFSTSTAFSRLSLTETSVSALSVSISNLSTSTSNTNLTLSTSISNLSTSTGTSVNSLSTNISALSSSIVATNSSLIKASNTSVVGTIVPLNSKTLNNSATPIPISRYPVQENIIDVNGWYYLTTYKGAMAWTVYPTGTDGTTKLKYSNINQIYFTVYFNKPTPSNLIPQLYVTFGSSNYLTFKAPTTGVTYPLSAGTYTFAVRFDNATMGNTSNIVNTEYNNLVGRIINLSLDTANSNPSNPTSIGAGTFLNNIQLITPTSFSNTNNLNYVIIGDSSGNAKYSTDGINYTNDISGEIMTSISDANGFVLTNGSILWMLNGSFTSSTNCIAYSTTTPNANHITNQFANISSIFAGTNVSGIVNSIEYNNKYSDASASSLMFLAGGQIISNGTANSWPLAYSTNGTNWTQFTSTLYSTITSTLSANNVINVICYSYSSQRWLIGLNSRTTYSTLLTATNSGTTFTFAQDVSAGNILNTYIIDIEGNLTNTLYIAVGKGSNNNQIISSTTGNLGSWSLVSANLFSDTTSVKCNGSMWLIGGSGSNSLAYSLSGTSNWIGLSKNTITNPFDSVRKIVWSGLSWVACGLTASSNQLLAYSYSGTIWTSISMTGSITGLGCLYPNLYQFSVNNLYLENTKDTNVAGGTVQYIFTSGEVDNNYQYSVLDKLLSNLYKMDLYTYSDPLTITTL